MAFKVARDFIRWQDYDLVYSLKTYQQIIQSHGYISYCSLACPNSEEEHK